MFFTFPDDARWNLDRQAVNDEVIAIKASGQITRSAVAEVPVKAYDRPGKYITLTTCDPEWGSSHRLIAWGHLESVQPLSAGEPAALKGAA